MGLDARFRATTLPNDGPPSDRHQRGRGRGCRAGRRCIAGVEKPSAIQANVHQSVSPQFCVTQIEGSEANEECLDSDRVVSEVGEIHLGDGVVIIDEGATWRITKRFNGAFTLGG